jgi:hypothetical protein
MSDFGHSSAIGPGFAIDAWGAGPFKITVGKSTYRFEDSDMFGPVLIDKDGEPKDEQPGQRSPFWRAHALWRHQGRKVDGETCLWHEPRPTLVQRIGRIAVVIEQGETAPDGLERYEVLP